MARRLRDLIRGVPWIESVGEVATAQAAIAAVDELQPDLLFLRVQLPGLSGLDVLARLITPGLIGQGTVRGAASAG